MTETLQRDTFAIAVEADATSGVVRITPSGKIHETFMAKDVEALLSQALANAAGQPLEIDLSQIVSMNSLGIGNWVRLISVLEKRHLIRFSVVGELIVDLAAMMPKILGDPKHTVARVQVPYCCPRCDLRVVETYDRDILKSDGVSFAPPALNCGTCQQPMEFDSIAEEYAAFLSLRKSGT